MSRESTRQLLHRAALISKQVARDLHLIKSETRELEKLNRELAGRRRERHLRLVHSVP